MKAEKKSQAVSIGLICLLLSILVYTQSGCGASAEAVRRGTIAAQLDAVKIARAAFHNWDVQQQERIASSASSREEGEAKLKLYRSGRDNVTRAFAYVLSLLLEAAAGEDEYSLVKASAAAGELVKGIRALKIGADPPAQNTIPCGGFSTTSTECKEF